MNTVFVLIPTVLPISRGPIDTAISVHKTIQECVTVAAEQRIPDNCYPVDKVIHQDDNEVPTGL